MNRDLVMAEISPAHQKTWEKFKKRREKEAERNAASPDFEFAAANDHFWFFRFGIKDGPYRGQTHVIEVKLAYGAGDDVYVYPMHAPKCSFVTKVWHPNVSEKGTICLDILKDEWSPSMFTANIVSAIEVLLLNAEVSSPQNKEAAEMMVRDPKMHAKKIASFYKKSAVPGNVSALF